MDAQDSARHLFSSWTIRAAVVPDTPRKIIHLDMDAFYASIEQRDDSGRYAGQPIAVGGGPPRSVVMTASYTETDGSWKTVYDRFRRWAEDGTLKQIVHHLQVELDAEGESTGARSMWIARCSSSTNGCRKSER
jgi:hypothetical protein